jgi:putative flippase GtrA
MACSCTRASAPAVAQAELNSDHDVVCLWAQTTHAAPQPEPQPLRVAREELSAEAARLARYLTVGGAGLATDSSVFALLSHLGEGRAVARAASIVAATALTWALNRRVTFRPTGRRRREELARYAAVAATAQGINYALFLALSAVAPSLQPLALIPACSAVSAAIAYTGQRLFTFLPARAASAPGRRSAGPRHKALPNVSLSRFYAISLYVPRSRAPPHIYCY